MPLPLPFCYTTLALVLLLITLLTLCLDTLQTAKVELLSAAMTLDNPIPILQILSTAATLLVLGSAHSYAQCPGTTNVSLEWHPPAKYFVDNLSTVINATGPHGFIYDTSEGPADTYNWCNMPHTNPRNYPKASGNYSLVYVEVIHRHHKRTPYADNNFPKESYAWDCSDEGLYYGGKPFPAGGSDSAATYWSVYTSASNPYPPSGFNGTCQFPQITRAGLEDSYQHGADLKAVYATQLGFLPANYDAQAVSYRVTNNVITSQVASMLIAGMYPERKNVDTPLLIQPNSIDSLEPKYPCQPATDLLASYGPGSSSPAWQEHLQASTRLFERLDALTGVDPNATNWHISFDHYFDNLSARLCHQKALPCRLSGASEEAGRDCLTRAEADRVFHLGQYEYSFIYRDSRLGLPVSVGSWGIWLAELAQNLREAMGEAAGTLPPPPSRPRYRHNVAHDGSLSKLLAILQLERMVWPGMGAEVVFELYSDAAGCYYLRVLWGGQVLRSSHPAFGRMEMVPISTFLAYSDGLVGVGAGKIPDLCATTS